MKLVTYVTGSEARAGLLVGSDLETIIDVSAGLSHVGKKLDGRSVLALVEAGKEALGALAEVIAAHGAGKLPASATVASKGVTLASPIPRPPSMRDGYAFRQHVETARKNRGLEMIPEFDQFPVFYFTNHQAV